MAQAKPKVKEYAINEPQFSADNGTQTMTVKFDKDDPERDTFNFPPMVFIAENTDREYATVRGANGTYVVDGLRDVKRGRLRVKE
jgi:hypothetical protein